LIGFGYTDQVDVPELDKMPHLGIAVAGLFTYELQNLDDQDWKNFDDSDFPSNKTNDDIFEEFEGQNGGMFGNGTVFENGTLKDPPGFSQTSIDQFTSTVASTSNLPFGPQNDQLQSLLLTAFFPSAPRDSYLDNDVYSEMDAVRAPIWILGCNFYPENQQNLSNASLSNMLNNAIFSFNINCANDSAEKSNNLKGKIRNRVFRRSQVTDIPGTFKSDDSAYDAARFSRSSIGGIVDMDDVDIDEILRRLFHPLSNKIFPSNAERINTLSGIPLLSTSSLSHQFCVRTVPYKSFLWNLLEYLLETVSRMNSSGDSFLGFLKILWNETLREIRLHWERIEPLPDVNIYMSENENLSSVVNQNGSLSTDDNKVKNPIVERHNIGIDMKYSIIHQKLCMINCCVTRIRQDQKYNPILSTSPKYQISSNNSLGSSDSILNNKMSKNSLMEQKQTSSDPFVRLFDHITGEDTPEASVILVPPVNSNGASVSDVIALDEKEIKSPNVRKLINITLSIFLLFVN
jgi:hypothetical protein